MKAYHILFYLLILVSCNQKNQTEKNPTIADSTAMVIALIPTLDCIPFNIAQESFDSLGINIKSIVYASQKDAEQALINGDAICCATDLFSFQKMKQRKQGIKFLFSTQREWGLAVGKQLRTTHLRQLADRLIGMERQTTSEYICDYIEKQIPNEKLILRPQISCISTRYDMMVNGQTDAAILPEPWITIAKKDGHSILALPDSLYKGYCGFAISENIQDSTFFPLIEKAYNNAISRLRNSPKLNLSKGLIIRYGISEVFDSINTQKAFYKSTKPIPSKIINAKRWHSIN